MIFDRLKSIWKVLQEAGKIGQYQQILDTQQQLFETQNKIVKLEAENTELKTKLKIKEGLRYENNAYWLIEENKKDGPFCSRCWDVEKNTVRLKSSANPAFRSCPECKTSFQIGPVYDPPQARQMRPPSWI